MKKECSNCKFGYKCGFLCICTKAILGSKYVEFKEQSTIFRNELQTYFENGGKYQLKFDTYKFIKEFVSNNITEFNHSCGNYVFKIDKHNRRNRNDKNESKDQNDNFGSLSELDIKLPESKESDDKQNNTQENPETPKSE